MHVSMPVPGHGGTNAGGWANLDVVILRTLNGLYCVPVPPTRADVVSLGRGKGAGGYVDVPGSFHGPRPDSNDRIDSVCWITGSSAHFRDIRPKAEIGDKLL